MADLSSDELARLAGCSYRQIDYWARQGALVPLEDAHGSGSCRRWRPEDVALAKVTTLLSEMGAKTDVWRSVCRALRWHPELFDKRQVFGPTGRRGARSGYLLDLPAIQAEADEALAGLRLSRG